MAKPLLTAAVQIPTGCAQYKPASTSHDAHDASTNHTTIQRQFTATKVPAYAD
jgi:hypothetical protein